MANNYKETPRAYLQRALGDLDNARNSLASCISLPSDNDIKWAVRNIEEHIRKASEQLAFFKHEVNNNK